MHRRAIALVLYIALLSTVSAGAETTAADIVGRMVRAAGGTEAFQGLGVLQIEVAEEETRTDGTALAKTYTAYVDTTNLTNLRLELGSNVVLACHSGVGWATVAGKIDSRPLAPRMASGTLRQRLFPLLLPFSLQMDGVRLGKATEDEFEGEPVWRLEVTFDESFFASPIMITTWELLVRRSDHALLAAEFLPPTKFREAQKEGVRYRPLTHDKVDGVMLSKQLMVTGLDLNGIENAHVRIVKMEPRSRGPYEPTLFLDPAILERLEESVPGFEDEPE